jgi:hypothetical protein
MTEEPHVTADDTDPPATGVASADAAAQRLTELDEAPLEEHVGIYEDVHRRLQEGLSDLDEQ